MSYVQNNLMIGEEVIYTAKMHWIIYVPAIVMLVFGVLLLALTDFVPIVGSITLVFSLISFVKSFITKISTELAVTSKRVIVKTGLIRRNTIELNHSKVESFHVDQSITGRIFGFGTIMISGTGGGKTPIPSIDEPLEFRRQAMQVIDPSQ